VSGIAFADTSALLAIASPSDQHHLQARAAAQAHLAEGGVFLSTPMVLGELHALLMRRVGGSRARRIVTSLLDDPAFRWEDLPTEVMRDAVVNWIERFGDQSFTLVDAVSFEVMRRKKVGTAFAFDVHFTTAGFEVLG
jgi:predicted nucleic acid-binding protein